MRKNRWKLQKTPRTTVVMESIGKKAKRGPQIRIWIGVTEEPSDPLDAVRALRDSIGIIEMKISDEVRISRAEGATWQEIGNALGMSRQAAWERYSLRDAN